MSDLISRGELLKRFLVNKDGHRIPERDCDNLEVTISVKDVKTIIKDQPTAYDVEKVVDELKEVHEKFCKNVACDELCEHCEEYIMFNKNIKIVKQGGVYDDVCKWELASDGEFIQNPHTKRLYSNEPSMQNVYCNTCGKKIKVVE